MRIYILLFILLSVNCSLYSQSKDKFLEEYRDVPAYSRDIDTTKIIDISEKQVDLTKFDSDFLMSDKIYLLYGQSDEYSIFIEVITDEDSIDVSKYTILDGTINVLFIDKMNKRCFKINYYRLLDGHIENHGDRFFLTNKSFPFHGSGIQYIEELTTTYPFQKKLKLTIKFATKIGQRDPKLGDILMADICNDKTFDYSGRVYLSDLSPSYPYNIYYIDYDDFLNIYDDLKRYEKLEKQ